MDLNKAGYVDYNEFCGAALLSQMRSPSGPSLLGALSNPAVAPTA